MPSDFIPPSYLTAGEAELHELGLSRQDSLPVNVTVQSANPGVIGLVIEQGPALLWLQLTRDEAAHLGKLLCEAA